MDFYWLQDIFYFFTENFDKPGSGGIIFAIVLGTAATTYLLAARWVLKGNNDDVA